MKGETTCEIKLFPEVLHSVNNFIQHIFTTWSRTISWDGSASGCELDKDEFSKSLSIVVISSAPKQAKYLEHKASRVYCKEVICFPTWAQKITCWCFYWMLQLSLL